MSESDVKMNNHEIKIIANHNNNNNNYNFNKKNTWKNNTLCPTSISLLFTCLV